MRKLRKTAGFTIVELLVALCVVGAVGAVAAPTYVSSTKTIKGGEAQANLSAFFLGQKVYRANNGRYWNASGASIATINSKLGLNLSPKEYTGFNYSGGDSSFEASFAEQNNSAHKYTISDSGGITQTLATPIAPSPIVGLNTTAPTIPTITSMTTDPLIATTSYPTTAATTDEPQDATRLAILAATAAAPSTTTSDSSATLWKASGEAVINEPSDAATSEVSLKRAAAMSDPVAAPVAVSDPTPPSIASPIVTVPPTAAPETPKPVTAKPVNKAVNYLVE